MLRDVMLIFILRHYTPLIPLSNYTFSSSYSEMITDILLVEVSKCRHPVGIYSRINYLPIRSDTTVMAESDGEGQEDLSSLPRRAIQRIVRDVRHDIHGTKRKGADIIPSVFILFLEKWLGFWISFIGSLS